MKKLFFLLGIFGNLLLTDCKSKPDNKIDTISEAKEAAEEVGKATEAAQDRWAARKAKGDTLAMPYKDLEQYLPDIGGYQRSGGPKGSQVNMPGMGSWSQAEQEYESGEKRIKIEIFDYNASQMGFAGVTALYKMGFAAEDDEKKEGSADLGLKDVAAYETVYKQRQEAKLVLIVADRFFINLESDGSNDIDMLKSVARNMKLGELASR